MKSKYIVIGVLSGLFIMVGIDIGSKYFGKKPPFTKGLYRKGLSGRVLSVSNNRGIATIKLNTSDSSYFFIPGSDPIRIALEFWSTVKKGDSLWKFPMSDTIHTLGKNGIEYRWPFDLQDQFGRSYLDKEK